MQRILPAVLALGLAATPLVADPIELGSREGAETPPHDCTEQSATTIISVVLCPAGLETEDFAEVGKAICGTALPCGVWMWEDEARMPEAAPENHDGLTQDNIAGSSGVWVAEDNIFISLEEVAGN